MDPLGTPLPLTQPDADDLRIWGGEPTRDPTEEEVRDLIVAAWEACWRKQAQPMTDALERITGRSGGYLFSACYGWATLAVKALRRAGPSGGGVAVLDTPDVLTDHHRDLFSDWIKAVSASDEQVSVDAWRVLPDEDRIATTIAVLMLSVAIVRSCGMPT